MWDRQNVTPTYLPKQFNRVKAAAGKVSNDDNKTRNSSKYNGEHFLRNFSASADLLFCKVMLTGKV